MKTNSFVRCVSTKGTSTSASANPSRLQTYLAPSHDGNKMWRPSWGTKRSWKSPHTRLRSCFHERATFIHSRSLRCCRETKATAWDNQFQLNRERLKMFMKSKKLKGSTKCKILTT